jgi:hypothetical protein
MKSQTGTFSEVLNNRRGSTLLAMLGLSAFMVVAAVSVLTSYQSRQKIQAHAQAREDAANLAMQLQMIFSTPASCGLNLDSQGLGTTLDELTAGSLQKNLKMSYKDAQGQLQTMVKSGLQQQHLTISQVSFSSLYAAGTSPNGTGYVANLTISLRDSFSTPLKAIVLPILLTTDAAGKITSCVASNYPGGSLVPVTYQDLMCQQYYTGVSGNRNGLYYSPVEHTCINDAAVIASRCSPTDVNCPIHGGTIIIGSR